MNKDTQGLGRERSEEHWQIGESLDDLEAPENQGVLFFAQ
jgi:hypothetical protein